MGRLIKQIMPTPFCKICFKPIEVTSFATLLDSHLTVCDSCNSRLRPQFIEFELEGIHGLALYDYDHMIKEKLYLFKGCHDYELKDMFLERFRIYLRIRYFKHIVIPMPSWHEDDQWRGFNHVEAMFSCLKLPMRKIFGKSKPHKQANLSFSNRHQISAIMILNDKSSLRGKSILLVDDVMTSGETIKAALALLRPLNPKKINVLVMAKTSLK